tara:strand:+ start:154 stop:786 length:633 start_codon:yes stop_codon:yes gene_type:complete
MEEFKNKVSADIQKELINFFWANEDLHFFTNDMLKIRKPWQGITKELLEPILSNIIDTTNNLGDNYYYHKFSYLPHTDYQEKESWQIVIPLAMENLIGQQSFVVFDQIFLHNGRTFCGNMEMEEFVSNKLYRGHIKTEDATDLTNKSIPNKFYNKYLSNNYPEDLFWGLSPAGVFEWKPGNIMMFDSRHIHCTGKMNCDAKLGIALRFEQ